MFFTTPDQNLIMSVLEQTACLQVKQVHRLLQGKNPYISVTYTEKMLRQLRYMGRLIFISNEIIALPDMQNIDFSVVKAVSVMLDISDNCPMAISTTQKPYDLSFLVSLEQPKEYFNWFGIISVPIGWEQKASTLISGFNLPHIPIFLLEAIEQQNLIACKKRHYLAVEVDGRFQYRKGGGQG